jgi:tetratricopeptide (TPR) repeat protein
VAKGKSDPIRVWDAVRPRTPVAGRRASDTPLVGRERELTLLRGTVDRVQREREPQLLTLVGVPGIGKTRLVSELARELDRRGDWLWLEGRSLRRRGGRPGAGVNRAKLALFEGRFDDADVLIREAFELGQHDATANPRRAFDLQTYQLQRERGLLGEMADVVERAVEEHPTYPVWSYVLLDVDTELGREDRARARFERLAAEGFPLYLEMQWLFGMSLLPEVCRNLDDPEGANAVYARLQPFGRLNATLPPELCRGSVSRGLGILAATMGRWSEAEEHFEVALRMNAEMAARPWLAHTQYDDAPALLRRGEPGDHGRLAELLTSAAASARELGMHSLADKVSSLG